MLQSADLWNLSMASLMSHDGSRWGLGQLDLVYGPLPVDLVSEQGSLPVDLVCSTSG